MNRRGFLGGLAAALAAPAIIRTPNLLMPVRYVPVRVVSSVELSRITRVAFRPLFYVEVYKTHPLLSILLERRSTEGQRTLTPLMVGSIPPAPARA